MANKNFTDFEEEVDENYDSEDLYLVGYSESDVPLLPIGGAEKRVSANTLLKKINDTLDLLTPDPPDTLAERSIAATHSPYSARIAGTTTQVFTVTDIKEPILVTIGGPSPGGVFYDGASGVISIEVDSVIEGSINLSNLTFPLASDEVDGWLTVQDQGNPTGFYQLIRARIQPDSPLVERTAPYELTLTHNAPAAAQLQYNLYIDEPLFSSASFEDPTSSTPIPGIELPSPSSITRYISGVPSLSTLNSIIVTRPRIINAVGKFYANSTLCTVRTGVTIGTQDTFSQNLGIANMISSPPAEDQLNVDFNATSLEVRNNRYNENITVELVPFNSKSEAGTTESLPTFARVDTISNESGRIRSGYGQFPSIGTSSSEVGELFDSEESLVDNEELQLINGVYRYPDGDYTGNNPVPGPDYTVISDDWRYYTIFAGSQTDISAFTININGVQGTWTVDGNQVTDGLRLYTKIDGDTGWLNANLDYDGVSTPLADDDAAMVVASSTAAAKRVTLNTVRTGDLYVRIGLPEGSNKTFTGLTVTSIV